MKGNLCRCPLFCKYCGAKLRVDGVGHYCTTRNCDWQQGVDDCTSGGKREKREEQERAK